MARCGRNLNGGFPKLVGYRFGVPEIQIVVLWGLYYWGPPHLRNLLNLREHWV